MCHQGGKHSKQQCECFKFCSEVVVSSDLTDAVAKIFEYASLEGLRTQLLKAPDQIAQALVSVYQSYIDFGDAESCSNGRYTEETAWVEKIVSLCEDEASDYLEQMKLFCSTFKMELTQKDLQSTYESLLIAAFFGESHTLFKYHVNVIFVGLIEDESPPMPGLFLAETIFPRKLRVYLRREQAKYKNGVHKTRILSLFYSLFQGLKKALLPLRPHHVDQSLLKHKKALTTPPVPLTDKFRYFCQTRLRDDFKRLIVPKSLNPFPRSGALSLKSTIEASMSGGGQVGLAIQCLREPTSRSAEIIHFRTSKVHIPMEYFQGIAVQKEVLMNVRGASLLDKEVLSRKCYFQYSEFSDDEIIEELLFLKALGLLSSDTVQPCVVLEPLKGRIITKPSTGDYIKYNSIQNFLWKQLSTMRPFELIGRPVTETDIWYVSENYEDGDVFVSGDYSGATDNLSSELSEIIIRFLFSKYPKNYREDLMGTFCRALIDYTREPLQKGSSPWPVQSFESVELGKVQQKNGQLMGHVLSFIVLCLANYLTFQFSYWNSELTAPRCLINGDDILFKTKPERVGNWMESVRSVGFFPSVGKNLVNDKVCQINSELYEIKYANIEPSLLSPEKLSWTDSFFPLFGAEKKYIRNIVNIEYVNFGIIRGRGKGKTDEMRRVGIDECIEDGYELSKTLPCFWEDMRRNCCFDSPSLQKMVNQRLIQDEYIRSRPCLDRFDPELLLQTPELILRSSLESLGQEFDYVSSNSSGNLLRSSFVPEVKLLDSIRKYSKIAFLLPPGLCQVQQSVFGTLRTRMETNSMNRQ